MTSPSWKQLKHPLMGEYIDKWWCFHTMDSTHEQKWTIDTPDMGEFQNSYAKWTKPDKGRVHYIYTNSRTCKQIYNSRKQVRVTWGQVWKMDGLPRGMRKLWGVMGVSATLMVMMVSWEHLNKDVKEKITRAHKWTQQIPREMITPMLFKAFQWIEKKEHLQIPFLKPVWLWYQKPGKKIAH